MSDCRECNGCTLRVEFINLFMRQAIVRHRLTLEKERILIHWDRDPEVCHIHVQARKERSKKVLEKGGQEILKDKNRCHSDMRKSDGIKRQMQQIPKGHDKGLIRGHKERRGGNSTLYGDVSIIETIYLEEEERVYNENEGVLGECTKQDLHFEEQEHQQWPSNGPNTKQGNMRLSKSALDPVYDIFRKTTCNR